MKLSTVVLSLLGLVPAVLSQTTGEYLIAVYDCNPSDSISVSTQEVLGPVAQDNVYLQLCNTVRELQLIVLARAELLRSAHRQNFASRQSLQGR
jgi:hypothetical protein